MTIAEPATRRFTRAEYYQMGDIGLFHDQRVELIDGEIIQRYNDGRGATMTLAEPTTRRFTRAEYYQMADIGLFQDQRVELIDGEIIQMSPQNSPHALTIALLDSWLHRSLSDQFTIRCQLPLVVNEHSEPEPDFAVVDGPLSAHRGHPTSALLVIEVSETTLAYDRRKANLYASAQVPEYWILNLADKKLEVHHDPIPAPNPPFTHRYAKTTIFSADQTIQPLQLPLAPKKIAELFPAFLP